MAEQTGQAARGAGPATDPGSVAHEASRPETSAAEETVHATCVVVGEAGVLIRGPSGAGKSTFARQLLDTARLEGRFGRLVSDDRTRLCARHGRLLARAVASIAGRIEARGVGLVNVPHEESAVLRLVIELSTNEPSRWPDPGESTISLCGIMVSRLHGRSGASLAHLVLRRLAPFRAADEDKVGTR